MNPATARTGEIVSIAQYATELARRGIAVLPGSSGTYWIRHEPGALMRLPAFCTAAPEPGETRRALAGARAAVLSYLLEPDERHPANAWLYLCTDQGYALDKLPPAMRRNVRRALDELRIAPLTADELLAQGAQPFCDTRRRNGLSDGTVDEFRRQFSRRAGCPGHVFWGAWKGNALAGFLFVVEVDDWVELISFSTTSLLSSRPNDALFFFALSHYLTERRFRVVSYGVSSVQAQSGRTGLHAFKMKVGFEAYPVHRVFVLHPLLRPLANRITLWGIGTALRIWSGHRLLRKAGGVLACVLGKGERPDGFAAVS